MEEQQKEMIRLEGTMERDISDKERISDKLALVIFSSILNGAFPLGSRLPIIKTLLNKTNTSIEILRKALRILIDLKVISKTRQGYFVTDDITVIHTVRQSYIEQETAKYKAQLAKMACKAEIRFELLEV